MRRPDRNRKSRRGGALLETAMYMPVLILLFVGMVEIARITYTYYAIQRILTGLARYVGTQQAVNFCDDNDASVVAAKSFALTGTPGGDASASGPLIVRGLTADLIRVRLERYDVNSQTLVECDCSETGCDASVGGTAPDFIVVYLPNGYTVRPAIPGVAVDPFPLRPRVRVPYGGT